MCPTIGNKSSYRCSVASRLEAFASTNLNKHNMHLIIPMAAAGYSLIYLLCGGGLGGAVLIFIVAKMLGK